MRKTEWISVKDRLPQIGQVVLVYDAMYPEISTAERSLDGWNDYIGRPHYYASEIIYWMPLPEPPKP